MRTALGFLSLPTLAFAGVVTSSIDGGGGDLRSVIAAATPGDTITFDTSLDGQTMVLDPANGQLSIGISLTLDASALADGFTIDAAGQSRCLEIHSGTVVTIDHLTFTGGLPAQGLHGGGISNGGDLTLRRVSVIGNATADRSGGAGSGLTGGRGGGIYSTGPLLMEDCLVAENRTGHGESGFSGNGSSGGNGGGINFRAPGDSFTLRRCQILNNHTGDGGVRDRGGRGGGLHMINPLSALIEDSVIQGNRCGSAGDGDPNFGWIDGGAGADGGGLYVNGAGELTLLRSTIAANLGGDGGEGADGTSPAGRGGSSGSGGGMYLAIGAANKVLIEACTIHGNVSGAGGNGGTPEGSGGSSFGGGAIAFNGAGPPAPEVRILHSTITDNLQGAPGRPGDIVPPIGSPGILSAAAGLSGVNSVALVLHNSIVRGNRFESQPRDFDGNLELEGINVLEASGVNGTLGGSGSYLDADPHLTPLGDHGGHTPTRVPFAASPVIESGAPLSDGGGAIIERKDQRGVAQIGLPDIGAVESQGAEDLPLLWEQDWDGDGLGYGLERAIGTDPELADFESPRRLQPPIVNGDVTLEFGISPGAGTHSRIILERSTSPSGFSFEEVFRYDTNTDSETLAPGIQFEFTPRFAPTRVRVTDGTSAPRALYRLRVDRIPP